MRITTLGCVIRVSADTLNENLRHDEQPFDLAQVRTLGRQFSGRPDEKLEIQPGMTDTIEIKTGQRTVLQYPDKTDHQKTQPGLGRELKVVSAKFISGKYPALLRVLQLVSVNDCGQVLHQAGVFLDLFMQIVTAFRDTGKALSTHVLTPTVKRLSWL